MVEMPDREPSPNDANSADHYTQTGDHSWTLRHEEDIRNARHNVVGFGSASIPSYECIVRNIPDRTVTVCCVTWNVNEKSACSLSTISNFLSKKQAAMILEDVLAIALQEIPSHSRLYHEEALAVLSSVIGRTHSIYFSHRAWSQMLFIFIAKPHLRYAINNPTVKFVPSAAMAKPMRTKGSVGICFRLYQRMIVVVASHFSRSSMQNRLQSYHKMVQALHFPTLHSFHGEKEVDIIFSADVILWMGDLNFRIADCSPVAPVDPTEAMKYDELTNQVKAGSIFVGFKEAEIKFPPTHKMQPGSGDYVAGRTPSYTDRVLYWEKEEGLISEMSYSSLDEVTQSDHRPVHCSFKIIAINKPIPQQYYSEARRRSMAHAASCP